MSISGGNIRNIRYPAPTGYPAGYPDPVFQVRIYLVSGSGKKSVSGKTLLSNENNFDKDLLIFYFD